MSLVLVSQTTDGETIPAASIDCACGCVCQVYGSFALLALMKDIVAHACGYLYDDLLWAEAHEEWDVWTTPEEPAEPELVHVHRKKVLTGDQLEVFSVNGVQQVEEACAGQTDEWEWVEAPPAEPYDPTPIDFDEYGSGTSKSPEDVKAFALSEIAAVDWTETPEDFPSTYQQFVGAFSYNVRLSKPAAVLRVPLGYHIPPGQSRKVRFRIGAGPDLLSIVEESDEETIVPTTDEVEVSGSPDNQLQYGPGESDALTLPDEGAGLRIAYFGDDPADPSWEIAEAFCADQYEVGLSAVLA